MTSNHQITKDYDLSSLQNYLTRVPERHRADVDEFVAFKRSQGVKNGTLKNYALWLQKWCGFLERPLGEVTKQDVVAFFGDSRFPVFAGSPY